MHRWFVPLSLIVATSALLAACVSARDDDSGAVASIEAARAQQNQAIADGDADRIASFWTEDVTVRSGLGAAVAGRADYRARILATRLGGSRLVYARTPTSIVVSHHWPLAFESGSWAARLGNAGGAEVMGGRYSAQWVKRDGRWFIRAEVFVALTCEATGCDAASVP